MWYHVVIEVEDERHSEVETDLALDNINSRFLTPYVNREGVMIDGRFVEPSDIRRLTITASDVQYGQVDKSAGGWRAKRRTFALSGQDVTASVLDSAPSSTMSQGSPTEVLRPPTSAREVFVVHGRNIKARDELFILLRAFDLHPLEWEEAVQATGKPMPYVGEILEAAFSRAHAVVVLQTPDDEARLRKALRIPSDPPHEVSLSGQARPNVLFEAGMAMAWAQSRTVLVEIGELRPFSDVGGLHVVRLDGSSQSRQVLAQRLELAGCPVNKQGSGWHSAGDFGGVIRELEETEVEVEPTSTRQEGRGAGTEPGEELSADATELLSAAVDSESRILRMTTGAGLYIALDGGRVFSEGGDVRSEARWNAALDQLTSLGLVNNPYGGDTTFAVTEKGYEVADQLALASEDEESG